MNLKRVFLSIAVAFFATMALAAKIPEEQVTRPAGTEPFQGDRAELVTYGKQLWADKSLSGKGKTACLTCHKSATKMFKKSFLEPYPHQVKMAKKKSGMTSIDAEQMVQFCMLAPMKSHTLPWDSKELAALTAYTVDIAQKQYQESKKK